MNSHPAEGARAIQPVRVWSVPKEGTELVRWLGPYRGMLVHYGKDGPRHCRVKNGCPADRHRTPTTWKGYAAAEVFDQTAGVWVPWVVEITEGLEELLHGRTLRGEVWGLMRESRAKGRVTVTGAFLERCDPALLRPCFPIEAVLSRCYHEPELTLDIPNPMPPRLILAPSAGALPASLAEVVTAPAAPQEDLTQEKRLQFLQRMQRQKSAAPSANGKAPSANGQSGGHS